MEEKGEIGIASIHAALATGGRRGARTNQQTALSWRHVFGESDLLENEPTAPADQAHTTRE